MIYLETNKRHETIVPFGILYVFCSCVIGYVLQESYDWFIGKYVLHSRAPGVQPVDSKIDLEAQTKGSIESNSNSEKDSSSDQESTASAAQGIAN